MTTVILLVLGAILGSFLNVVGLRWDEQHFGGRSHCPKCSQTLRWYELIPVLSFLLQWGRCRHCGERISYQYPLVELLTGLIFATVPYIYLPVFCIYIVILIYDAKHKIIPDPLVYSSILLALIIPLFVTHYSVLDWLAGPIIFTFFGLIWLLSGGRAMGFGDAKLGLSIGLLLGALRGFDAIVLSFWLGAGFSVSYILIRKLGFLKSDIELTMKSEVPFAPFIILGAWLGLMLHFNFLHVPTV